MNKAQQRMLESRTLDLAEEVDGLKVANAILTARVAELEEALTPFADEAAELALGVGSAQSYQIEDFPDLGWSDFTVGDLRQAAATLNKENQNDQT